MKRCFLPLLVLSSLLLPMHQGWAGTRPRYGGTARTLVQHKVTSLDPLADTDYAEDRNRLASLLFETLTEIDAQGRLRPRLAVSWQPEPGSRVWRFQIRPASLNDGSVLTASVVGASLKAASPEWRIVVNGKQAISIETPSPVPHLPELLSLPRFAIVKRLADGTMIGTGPFKLSEWQPGERALFAANEEYWGGRPYLDAMEVRMGLSLREHLIEHQLGADHAAEPTIDQLHTLEQAGQSVALSRPSDLLVVIFPPPPPNGWGEPAVGSGAVSTQRIGRDAKGIHPKLREAVASAINRFAISNVLLQKRSRPAGALLPQWLTGYEFAFPLDPNPDQARRLRTEAGAPATIRLAYDYSDTVAKMVAERIAVDAREAGINLQPFGDPHVTSKSGRKSLNADAVLLRIPLQSIEPYSALAGLALANDLELSSETTASILDAVRPEDLFEAERKAIADYRLIPVAHVSEALWLNTTIHNWQQLPNGGWKLDQLWVEAGR
ncbi:MAG TPA: ABC transporter substrate-binding protein [Candidatus Angelobacter sp.]|nr:ABC transporter substrate-binding protein [Candidatus Angelobacter sp.]